MKQFRNILYVLEAASEMDAALERVVLLAGNNQADLTVIDVMVPTEATPVLLANGPGPTELQASLVAERRAALESFVEPYRKDCTLHVDVLVGRLFMETIRHVLKNSYDLIIKNAEDPDWRDRLFGSDDMHLLRKCPCPVWLMKPREKASYDNIVAAIDFNPDRLDTLEEPLNIQVLKIASSLALANSAILHVVHVWDAPHAGYVSMWASDKKGAMQAFTEGVYAGHMNGMNRLKQLMPAWIGREAYDYIAPRFHAPQGAPEKIIPAMAVQLQADLIVMGTVARTGITGLLIGNTAEAILDQLTCSVLAVKPAGFVSPITID
ncbi:universal stress protein [Halomonas sp. GXIMD04776]|uniref:universal stress protein n=1 Tax=Halomonas sp. GXIMD04776 TaxID=3415605 RepID=UPI003C9FA6B1